MTITAIFESLEEMQTFAQELATGISNPAAVKSFLTDAPDKLRPIDQPNAPHVEAQEDSSERTKEKQEKLEAAAAEPQNEEPIYSLEQVRARLAELQKAGKRAEVKELLNSFGVAKLSEIPAEQYGELMTKAGEI